MSNMSCCRFRNTTEGLEDCADNLEDELSPDEAFARRRLIKFAFQIATRFINDKGELDAELINELPEKE